MEWTLAQYACARAGLILVSVNPSFTTDELVYCLNKVDCKALIMADQHKRQNSLAFRSQRTGNDTLGRYDELGNVYKHIITFAARAGVIIKL